MNSNLANILQKHFPGITYYTSLSQIKCKTDEYVKIIIVRNPYDRLLSLFEDKCRVHPHKVRNRDKRVYLQNNQAQVLYAYAHLKKISIEVVQPEVEIMKNTEEYKLFLNNLFLLESISFIEFIDITEYLFSLSNMDQHFSPQSQIITIDGSMVIDHFFKLESINHSWSYICELIGTDIHLTHGVNRTNFEGPDKYQRFYNTRQKNRVYDLYRDDFIKFVYPK